MPGIIVVDGGDLQISGLSITFGPNGIEMPPPIVRLRMDMWPHWLIEGVNAAITAAEIAPQVTPDLAGTDSEEVSRLMAAELRGSMRALTSAAFAIDAFYASVKARSPEHPSQQKWKEKGTARHKQVAETIRHHLRINRNEASRELSLRVQEMFKFRDWAVHPGSQFETAIHREDVDAGVDWHFVAFRASNAVAGIAKTVHLLDNLVSHLGRGSEECANWKPGARRAMDHVLDAYEASDKLLPIGRAEPVEETGA